VLAFFYYPTSPKELGLANPLLLQQRKKEKKERKKERKKEKGKKTLAIESITSFYDSFKAFPNYKTYVA
jgi:hypothetical protein